MRKKILGMKPSEVPWSREIPFDADLEASAYTLAKLGESSGGSGDTLAAALILRMIYRGELSAAKDGDERVEISFNGAAGPGAAGASADGPADGTADVSGSADPAAMELREMMLKASGSDKVLQHNEFSRWAKRHAHEVAGWSSRALVFGRNSLRDQKYIYGSAYTPAGQSEARKLLGLKKFLQDFTLMGEKDTIEVILWQDYMVYGALFGIADKVAEQLRDINPDLFAEVMDYDYTTMHQLLFQTRLLSAAITNSKASVAAEAAQQSARGFGGGTSFGGGGGFSGGGFGGGSR